MSDRADQNLHLPEASWPETFQGLGGSPSRGDCPSAEQLWQAVAGELEPEAFRRIVDHTAECPACAEDFRLTRAMVEQSESSQDQGTNRSSGTVLSFDRSSSIGRPSTLRPSSRRWASGLAIAAALILVVLNWRSQAPIETPGDPIYRSAPSAELLSELDEGAALPRDQARLNWSGPEGARYDVVVTTDDLELVFEARGLSQSELTIPANRLADLADGTVLVWQVDAVLEGGERLSSVGFQAELTGLPSSGE